MAWAWTLEALFFAASAVAQIMVAGFLLATHRRQGWVWILAALFGCNGAVAAIRALLAATPGAPPELCLPQPCHQYIPGYEDHWFVDAHFGPVLYHWLEPATSFLLVCLFFAFPPSDRKQRGRLWVAVGLASLLAFWGLNLLAPAFAFGPPAMGWLRWARFLYDSLPSLAWMAVLLRGTWLLLRIEAQPSRWQFAVLFAVVGVRAARMILHSVLIQAAAAFLPDQEPRWYNDPIGVAGGAKDALLLLSLAASFAILAAALPRSPPSRARDIRLVLAFLVLGGVLAFFLNPAFSFTNVWGRFLTHYDLYVLRPAFVWVALVLPRFGSPTVHRWSAWLAPAFVGCGSFAAVAPALALVSDVVFAASAGLLAGLAAGWAVLRFLRGSIPSDRGGPARRTGDLDAYRAALGEAWAAGPPSLPAEARLEGLRRRLRVSLDQHEAFLAVLQADRDGRRDWRPGDVVLGRYKVACLLGEGGMGETYRCRDLPARREVVLKRTRCLDDAGRRALLAEAAALRRLDSPRIVRHVRIEAAGAEPVLVLDFAPGGSLQTRLAVRPRLEPAQAIAVALDVLEGLEASHREGIVHRDIKPANILFGADGRALLADFGAAQDVAGASNLADATRQPGSLRYMAPEQALGLPADVRSDLYAVAVLLCEALAGHHPARAVHEHELRQAILKGLAPPADLPAPLRRILAQALRRDPRRRPPSAAAMATALRHAQARLQPPRNKSVLRPTPTKSPA